MHFHFSNLENVNTAELVEIFNSAFSDYFVKIEFNEKSFLEKIATENILLEKSAGAFAGDKLVGFILIGIDEIEGRKTSYNGGTGVVSDFRGNQLTNQMYDLVLTKLKAENIYFQQLEVIKENRAAIRIYEKIGFQTSRTLACFRGHISPSKINKDLELKVLSEINDQLFPQFWNAKPSWQNSLSAIGRTKNRPKIVGAFGQNKLVGYIIYTENGRIKQFAVKKDSRHSGVAQTLFTFIRSELKDKEILINNVEKDDRETVSFLEKIGLTLYLEQFEMTMNVPK